jgi:prepilin-type N-terminal cleavage/methylation domain-containing protein
MKRRDGDGFTLIEVIVVLVVIAIFVGLILPATTHRPARATRIKCVNNLKNVGLAFRIFATDNGDRFPPEVMLTNGVPHESLDALRVFLTLTSELSTPKILYCLDDKTRGAAESFTNVTLKNLSYFASLSAGETMRTAFLAGDRNLQTNGMTIGRGLATVTRLTGLSWTREIHNEQGDIVLADGSVQQFSSMRLKQGVQDQSLELATNYLAVP